MIVTKEDVKSMTQDQRMALIDLIWEVTDEEHPEWVDQRSEDEILGEEEEPETKKMSN